MSIFDKPLSQVSPGDLQELLAERAVENVRLEFKLQVPSKEETLKKLSSFANTFGGFLVVGARAESVNGRIQELPGVDVESGFKQKVVQWCFDGASPPLAVEVSDPIPAPGGNGKVCYVAYTAASDLAPHFLNGRKGIWVRTDEYSAHFEARLADENEVWHLLDRRRRVVGHRAQLLERAKRRFDTHFRKEYSDPDETKPTSRLEFSVVPRFPSRQLFDQGKLREYLQKSRVPWRGVMFPNPDRPILCQHESAIVLNATKRASILEMNNWGLLFYGAQIDDIHNGRRAIHLYQFVGHLLLFVRHASEMLQAFGYVGPVHVETALTGIRGVPWLQALGHGPWPFFDEGSHLDDEVAFAIPSSSDRLREKQDAVAAEVLRYALFAVNAPHLIDTPQELEKLIRKGYSFNSWPPASSLSI